MPIISVPGLPFLAELAALFLLVVIGLVVIFLMAKIFLFVLPATIIAFVVWFLTGSFPFAGIAFIIVALISLARG